MGSQPGTAGQANKADEVLARYKTPDGCSVLVGYDACTSKDDCEEKSVTEGSLGQFAIADAEDCAKGIACAPAGKFEIDEGANLPDVEDKNGIARARRKRAGSDLIADASIFQLQLGQHKVAFTRVVFSCSSAGHAKHKNELDSFLKSVSFKVGKVGSSK